MRGRRQERRRKGRDKEERGRERWRKILEKFQLFVLAFEALKSSFLVGPLRDTPQPAERPARPEHVGSSMCSRLL